MCSDGGTHRCAAWFSTDSVMQQVYVKQITKETDAEYLPQYKWGRYAFCHRLLLVTTRCHKFWTKRIWYCEFYGVLGRQDRLCNPIFSLQTRTMRTAAVVIASLSCAAAFVAPGKLCCRNEPSRCTGEPLTLAEDMCSVWQCGPACLAQLASRCKQNGRKQA